MCGICGYIDFSQSPAANASGVLSRMIHALRHRGPDDSGVWHCDQGGVGHTRLAVLDPANSRQPMVATDSQGDVALSFSGEIYNYRELRSDLTTLGFRFVTAGDTEVVLKSYLQWGDSCVDRFAGMFAFAIWDGRSQRLLLARDRLGIKPLYYFRIDEGLLFGSEPKAIFAHPAVTPRVDADGLRQVFALVRAPGQAVYSGMSELEPGALLVFDRSGVRQHRYWVLEARPHHDDLAATIEHTRNLLRHIVPQQLVSDVPVCTLLSGGLDSSILASIAQEHSHARGAGAIRTASVTFGVAPDAFVPDEMRASPDDPFIDIMVRHLGTTHAPVEIAAERLLTPEIHAATLRARDLPSLGEIDATLLLLFTAVRRDCTVAISGEGADELFGGYRWFHDPAVVSQETFPWLAMSRSLGRYSMFEPAGVKLGVAEYQADLYADAMRRAPKLAGESAMEARMRQICYLHLTYFLPTPLERKDRMSMAVGLEVRVPYVDHRLIEYVFNVPWSMKNFDGREKSLLRAAARNLLPEQILAREKSPFPALLAAEYHSFLTARVRQILADGRSPVLELLQRPMIRALASASVRQAQAVRMGLERILALHDWLTEYRVSILEGT